jgi:hypothetical protein
MPTPADILELCKAQENKNIPVGIGRKITPEVKAENQARLQKMMSDLGWLKNVRNVE